MFITEIWRRQPGKYFCLTTKSASKKWEEHFFSRSEFGEIKEFLRDNMDKDIYWCPHGLKSRVRRKEYAELPSMLYADLDEVDPRKIKLKPTIAIESSPGRYVGLWLLDAQMNEDLNRRLTYMLGSDKGGWDLTQVLRVPGTTNYKYSSTPRVRLMYEDGPTYLVDDLERIVPKSVIVSRGDAKGLFEKYRKKLPYWVRNEMFDGKAEVGKRSAILWKLWNALKDAGVSRAEAVILVKGSAWNKFKGRHSEDEQLSREADKVFGEEEIIEKPNGYNYLSRSLDDVEEANTSWLWYPYLARREVTILEGDPGVGKSYVAEMISKGLCDGERLPSVKKLKPVLGKIAYFDTENNADTVTKKRMRWNGCRHMENFFQEEEPFSIDDEKSLGHVYDALEKLKPVLIVFDTINLYIGKADTGKGSDTTQALSVFKDMARRFNCSVLLLRHLTKGNSKEKALYRGQGNIAFAGVARIVMTLGLDPEDGDTKVLGVTKMNLAKVPRSLTFTVAGLPDTLHESDRSKFTWGGFVDLTSDEILQPSAREEGGRKSDALEFLKEVLDGGERRIKEIEVMAEKRSISLRTLQRAADELGVVKSLRGFGKDKGSWWSLAE